MLFEDIIEDIGGFGSFQIRLFVIVSLFESPAAWTILLPVFTSTKNPVICLSKNFTNICDEWKSCDNLTYTRDVKTSIISDWDLICDHAYIPTMVTTLQMAGILFGAGITGQLADQYGRKITLYSVYTGMLVASLVSSLATTWQMYAVCRALVGAFFGGTMVVNFVMPMEFVGKSWRTFCGCIGFWAVGVMTLPLLSYYVEEWRHLTTLTSIIGLLLLPTYWFIPESPRWLILKGRSEEAKSIILNIARINGKPAPDMEKLSLCIKTAGESIVKKYSYWNLFRTPAMTKNALIIIYCWFVCGSVYYGSTMSVGKLTGSSHLNLFLSGLVEIPALLFVVLINNRIGRRWTLFSLMTMAAMSYVIILASIWTGRNAMLIRISALVGKAGISGSWAAAQIYSAELFPTVIRNIGIASCSMAARIGIITVPKMIELNETITFLWCGCLTMVAALMSFSLPETLNTSLPDVLPALDWPCYQPRRPSYVGEPAPCPSPSEDPADQADYDVTHFYRPQCSAQSTNL